MNRRRLSGAGTLTAATGPNPGGGLRTNGGPSPFSGSSGLNGKTTDLTFSLSITTIMSARTSLTPVRRSRPSMRLLPSAISSI